MPLAEHLRPKRYRCFEYRRLMTGGLTSPQLVSAADENGNTVEVVLKVRTPRTPIGVGHFGATSLACELVSAVVAQALGVLVPPYGIAEVGPIFANSVRDEDVRQALVDNVGPNFATALVPHQQTWDPACSVLSLDLRQAIDNVLSLDATILNGDRSRGKPNLLWDGRETVRVIDHSLACAVYRWDPETRDRSPLLPDKQIRDHSGYAFLHGKRSSFNQLHDRWRAALTPSFWDDLRSSLPREWEQQAGDFDAIFQFLRTRSERFTDIGLNLRGLVQ